MPAPVLQPAPVSTSKRGWHMAKSNRAVSESMLQFSVIGATAAVVARVVVLSYPATSGILIQQTAAIL
jgi:hypothetical protein